MQKTDKKMSQTLILSLVNQEVIVQVMLLKAVKRATLRYDMKAQEFRIRAPSHYKQSAVEGFLKRAQGWMEKQLSKTPPLIPIQDCEHLSLLGQEIELIHHISKRVSFFLNGGELHVMSPSSQFGSHLEKWLKQVILDYFCERSEHYSAFLGIKPTKVSIRETKSRWGSCSAKGALSFNWRLIFAPKEVIDYVIVHEVAHLQEMNHSAKFWRLVTELYPEFNKSKEWLRKNGSKLFQLQF